MSTRTIVLDHEVQAFVKLCLDTPTLPTPYYAPEPLSPASSPDGSSAGKSDDIAVVAGRLTKSYPSALTDFYGIPSGAPCIFKSGPIWKQREPGATHPIRRELRPVYGHAIASQWRYIAKDIYELLDQQNVIWTSIDPVGVAEQGQEQAFCKLIIWIGVSPGSLSHDNARDAALGIKMVLRDAGHPDLEVAFRETVVTSHVKAGSEDKFRPFKPSRDPTPDITKYLTATLGLAIAPTKFPHFEGTGTLYLRPRNDPERILLLTAAHVAHPPPVFPNNKSITHRRSSQFRENILALGSGAWNNAIVHVRSEVSRIAISRKIYEKDLAELTEADQDEDADIDLARKTALLELESADAKLEHLNRIHKDLTSYWGVHQQRTFGHVLHVEPIVPGCGDEKYTLDWALIECDFKKFNLDSFTGNKIFIGGKMSRSKWVQLMYPHPEDQKGLKYPITTLLEIRGVVKKDELRSPRHREANGEECLFVVKNGMATGTTVGRANGLESVTRSYPELGIHNKPSFEVAILSYDGKRGPFSAQGDSGAAVLDRGGRLVGVMTAGSGLTTSTDVTYVTPWWWLELEIKKRFDVCFYDSTDG